MPQLLSCPIHLGNRGKAFVEPTFDGMKWFASYSARHHSDGSGGWLVMQHAFGECWTEWEIHPEGSEVVLCLDGHLTLIQQDGEKEPVRIELREGDYAINPPGVWHTADVADGETAVCLFVTAGAGTHHRSR